MLICSANAGASVSRLRTQFAGQAAAITESPFRFVPTTDGFAPDSSVDGRKFQLQLPPRGEDAFLLEWPDRQLQVQEQGLSGRGELEGSAVTYRRPGGASFWTTTEHGYEEWLLLDAGVATKTAPVATWFVEGATIEAKGEAVELRDEKGSALVRITAPAAWTADGRPVEANLVVSGSTIELWVAADGSALLIDPLWTEAVGDSVGAANGQACSTGSDCGSGFCADGVCCNTACNAGSCDACSVATGAAANGTCALLTGPVCSDGNACTQTDVCQNGICSGSNPVICPTSDQCHLAGTCDSATGFCSNPAKANGSACNDGNGCTQTDICQNGVCAGGNPVVCQPSDQCHSAGTCDLITGACSNPAKMDGAACTDGNACTQDDTCHAGACVNGSPVTCTPSDQCHSAGTCNSTTGNCSNPAKSDGSACNDGNACSQTDTCQGGICSGSDPVICAPLDQCHEVGLCNPVDGQCSLVPKANGAACNDGNGCTQSDSCQSGICVGSNEVSCSAFDQCHVAGTCDPTTGMCSNPSKTDGAACDDGNACSQSDTCQIGVCVGSDQVVCAAIDQCHEAGECDPATGMCSDPDKAAGAACDDGNACSQSDVCQSGVCVGGEAIECPAMGECREAGTCDQPTGVCSTGVPKQDGTPCTNGTCANGTCVMSASNEDGGSPVDAGTSGTPDGSGAATTNQNSGCDCQTAGSGLLPMLVLVGLSGVLRRRRARIG